MSNKGIVSGSTYRSSRSRQIFKSIPHYLPELRRVRSPGEFCEWLQFKMPYLFPLPAFPPRITLELTNECNLACRHCHRNEMNRPVGMMDGKLLEKIAAEIGRHPTCAVKLGGLGEPALHPDCKKLVTTFRDRRTRSSFYTNGTLLHQIPHEELLREWKIPHLIVSVDGLDAKSYEQIRAGGEYDRLRAAVQAFVNARKKLRCQTPLIEVRHVIFPHESDTQIAEFRRSWLQVADTVMFNPFVPHGPVNACGSSHRRRCRDIRREFYISWNGMAPLCGYQYLVTGQEWIADLHDMDIQQAWRLERLEKVRAMHRKGIQAIPDFCKLCHQTA